MDSRSPGDGIDQLNADVAWDTFDPAAYIDHNYRHLLAEDQEIVSVVRRHFSDHFRRNPGRRITGIDVGAGANLYPALSMLPWCEEITLLDRSAANVGYLKSQVEGYDANWDQFWDVLCEDASYTALGDDPRVRFRQVVRVEQGDLFDLAGRRGNWSMGTMFFVAESLSTSRAEFQGAVDNFMRALVPGAPFAAAFMEHSLGYSVGDNHFPACDISESDVRESFGRYAGKLDTCPIGEPNVVREGYSGMIVAWGLRDPDASAEDPAG
ncbi:SCO2525 family SAM-dependent methyltransferase [Streptomyces sp. Tue6028]|uniref:SCO2525 family SAM-dependent methyltransferase n=1 Tax=Streptomyces sp. Tue6028 TaxID=2036037 RepID=UPI003D7055FD